VHRYFGGWSLRTRGVQFAMVMDTLYFRVDDATRLPYEAAGSTPFTYTAAGRKVVVRTYYSVPPEAIDDPSALCELARRSLAQK
jgi:TfoX/Sxy family transcriptional regulator of competence genes